MLIVEGVLTWRSVVSVHLLVLSNQFIGICRASLVLHATLMGSCGVQAPNQNIWKSLSQILNPKVVLDSHFLAVMKPPKNLGAANRHLKESHLFLSRLG